MEYPTLSARWKTALLSGAGLVIAVWVGAKIASSEWVLLLMASAGVMVSVGFFSGTFLWLLTIASLFLAGTFPILGGSFTPFQILVMMALTKFVLGDMALRRVPIRWGNRLDIMMIAGFIGVLTIHALHDRFGMRFLGSNVWGGRNYVNVFLGLAAFIAIQSVPIRAEEWANLPYMLLAITGFDSAVVLVTTAFPSLIYVIYPFYSAVSRTAIEEVVTGSSAEVVRLVAIGGCGLVIITLVLASTPLRRILHPANFWRLLALVSGFLAVIFSSFRSNVFNALVLMAIWGFKDMKARALLLVPVFALVLFGVSFVNSEVVRLPKAVQRSVVFVPGGDWDTEMKLDAASSNDFRREVWTLWWHEYFPAHPLLGRGFGFRSEWGERSVYHTDPDEMKQAVEVGNIHNGLFAALDTFGIVGTIFFIVWNIRLLGRCLRIPFHYSDRDDFALRFVALYLGAGIVCYWTGAANVGAFLPQEFALAGVFFRLQHEAELPPTAIPASPNQEYRVAGDVAVT